MQNHEVFLFIKHTEEIICDVCGKKPKRVLILQDDPRYPLQNKDIYLCEKHLKELKDFLNQNV